MNKFDIYSDRPWWSVLILSEMLLQLTIQGKRNSQTTMFSLRSVLKSLALLVSLFQSSSVVFAQQQQEDDVSATLMTSDDNNTDLSLLLTNYNALSEEGQGFYLRETSNLHEKPNSLRTSFVGLNWW